MTLNTNNINGFSIFSLYGTKTSKNNPDSGAFSPHAIIKSLKSDIPEKVERTLNYIVENNIFSHKFTEPLIDLLSTNDARIFGKTLVVLMLLKENGIQFTSHEETAFKKRLNGAEVRLENGAATISIKLGEIRLSRDIILETGNLVIKDGRYYLAKGTSITLNGYTISKNTEDTLLFFDEIEHQKESKPCLTFNLTNNYFSFASNDASANIQVLYTDQPPCAEAFMKLQEKERSSYLQNLVSQKQVLLQRTVFYPMGSSSYDEAIRPSGLETLISLKKQLTDLYEKCGNSKQKEMIYASFQQVHRFLLEKNIIWPGKQEITIYNSDETLDVGPFASRIRDGKSMYDPHVTNSFLENGKEGQRLLKLMKEIHNAGNSKVSELTKIKNVYDLVASAVPFFHWYGNENGNKYQSFEQLLKNKAGVCTEKNALLVYALRQIGIDADLLMSGYHMFARVNTSEGVLDIDVTSSDPFNLTRPATKGNYIYSSNNEEVRVDIGSEETISSVANTCGISILQLKEILNEIKKAKPHPLYQLVEGSSITPQNAGKYIKDLFQ